MRNPAQWSLAVAALVMVSLSTPASSAEKRPIRGSIGMSVLLCKYQGADAPANPPSFYRNLAIQAGTGGHADYWNDVSYDAVDFDGSAVKGWYTMDVTADEARDHDARIQKWRDCRDAAKDAGYDPPSDHIVVAITSPGIDVYGFGGGAFLGETTSAGLMAHEVGHGMGFAHSFSNDPDYKNASWAAFGVYDDPWDVMSYANVYSTNTGSYGLAPPGPNAYHRDRMGWLELGEILRFGADRQAEKTVTLRALSASGDSGYRMVRIPFDTADPFHYFTVEYRVKEDWDAGIPQDVVVVHEVKERSEGQYRSYLLRSGTVPVIIAGPPSYNGDHPGVARLREVLGANYGLQFQEWDYREREHGDTSHRTERIPYIAIEPGRHNMADGRTWEAGTFRLDGTREWVSESFKGSFAAPPRVYLTVQTKNGEQAVAVRARNVTANGFEAALFEEEALNDGHLEEVVGYLAVERGAASDPVSIGGIRTEYSTAVLSVNDNWRPAGGAEIQLDEGKSMDSETSHVPEDVDVLDLGSRIFAQPVTVNGRDTASVRHRGAPAMMFEAGVAEADQDWNDVTLGAGHSSPVVITGPPGFRGSDPGNPRLRQVAGDGFEVRFQEWDYRERDEDDTNHTTEKIPYLAVEPGRHSLADGSTWEAGTFRLDGTRDWLAHSFDSSFPGEPKVFLTVQSANGEQAVATRARNVTADGFEAALFEEEALNDGHLEEEVGYLAVYNAGGSGNATVGGLPVSYAVSTQQLDDSWSSVAGVDLRLEEEASVDSETNHVTEDVDVLELGGRVFAQQVTNNGRDTAALRHRGSANVIVEASVARADTDWTHVALAAKYGTGSRPPREEIRRRGVEVEVLSKDPANGTARVRIRSEWSQRCKEGYVWREARAQDKTCVTPERRTEVARENRLADERRKPGGGDYGPDTCKEGFVWREAYPDDHVCVPPESRAQTARENGLAFERRLSSGAYGPNTCADGYVWREADARDYVCVTPERRGQVQRENRLADERRKPGGGAYGPDTCKEGYVWREAYPGDHVCVKPDSRAKAASENKKAHDRLAKKDA